MFRSQRMFRQLRIAALLAILILTMTACGKDAGGSADLSGQAIDIVATTGMIADAAAHVGGTRVNVKALMGPGVDPHLYKASASDVDKLDDADVIFYNGLHLEGRMQEIFERLAENKPTFPVTATIDESRLLSPPQFEGNHDPHIWFDVDLWSETVRTVETRLGELDPQSAELYTQNANAYISELKALDIWVTDQIETIPSAARVLITAHDAFGYFGERYGMEVRGLQGTSTATEAGAADVQDLADFITERQIAAIFVESSVPQETIEAVEKAVQSRGWDVQIGGQLFSDAMGADGTLEGNYVGMVRYNVTTIVTALTGTTP
jgi:manganese/zinc/iron transport system substrate-binding protein